jgi:hypothetical protein
MKKFFCLCGLEIWLVAALWAGTPQTIDLTENWKFKPEPSGKMPQWQLPAFKDMDWAVLKAGARWEDQGFPNTDSYAWYRKEIDLPAEWGNYPIWLILGAVNDAFVLYCNGQLVNEFGDSSRHNVANIPALANLTPFLTPGRRNIVALRVFDWGGSGGLWQPPCLLTIDQAVLDKFPVLFCEPLFDKNQIDVNLNLTLLGRHWQQSRVEFSLNEAGTNQVLLRQSRQLTDEPGVISVQFELADSLNSPSYRIQARLETSTGVVVLERSRTIDWQGVPSGKKPRFKVLNNFVSELARRPLVPKQTLTIQFENPRDGWVFFALEGLAVKVTAELNGQVTLKWRLNPTTQTPESMLYLHKGTHTLQLHKLEGGELVIRAIPEIIYSQYPSTPHIEAFGPYNWKFLTRYVLAHVNTIVTSSVPDQLVQWQEEGRKWLVCASLPGLSEKIPPSAAITYETWAASPGANRPEFGGLIVDEFMLNSRDYYQPWTEAMVQLYQNPDFSGKHFYAYCNDLFQNPYLPAFDFSRTLLQHGGRFALERYLPLPATEAEAQAMFQEEFQHAILIGSHQLPELKEHLVVCLGYMADPPEMLNRLPHVNFKVFMDMQFHFLANNPSLSGLFGIQEYLSSYADEEVLRWAHRLFRHYCIEGQRTRFTTDPFLLPHLKNPDFVDGLTGWQAEPAVTKTIRPGTLAGFSWLQGRYPQIATGDQGMVFKRSAQQPNRLRQILQALEPGHWYSLKLISADVNQLNVKQQLGLSITINNAIIDQPRSFHYVFPSNYAHAFGPYNVDHPAWINYQRLVFRAEKATAELTISDWAGETAPGGPVGQEIIFNFIEVRPYLWEE